MAAELEKMKELLELRDHLPIPDDFEYTPQ